MVTDEGWYSWKQLSGPVDQKNEEKTPVSSSKALTRFSSLSDFYWYYVKTITLIYVYIYISEMTDS